MPGRSISPRTIAIFLFASVAGAFAVAAGWGAAMNEASSLPRWLASRTLETSLLVAGTLLAALTIMLPRDRLGGAARCAVLIVLLVAMIVLPRLYTFFEAFERDLMVYMTSAARLLDGHSLYSQVWDHKPPAVHWSYAAAAWLLGPTPAAIAFLGLAMALVTLAGCFVAGSLIGGRIGGAAAALVWALASGDFMLQANQPNVEVFINACLVWAFVFLVWQPLRRGMHGREAMAGFLLFLASLYKPIVLPAAALLLAAQALTRLRAGQRFLPVLVDLAVPGVVIVLGWSAILAGFAANGTLPDFIEAVSSYNQAYAGDVAGNIVAGVRELLLPAFLPYLLIGIVAGAVLLMNRRRIRPLPRRGIAAWLLGAWIALALPGGFFDHYFQLLLPPIAIVFGGAIGLMRHRRVPVMLLCASAVPLLFVRAVQSGTELDTIPIAKYGPHGVQSIESRQMASWLQTQLRPGDRLFQWGAEPGVYFWAKRPLPYKFSYSIALINQPGKASGLGAKYTRELLAELEAMPPEVIVATRTWIERLDHPVTTWIKQRYDPVEAPTDIKTFLVLRRRHGS